MSGPHAEPDVVRKRRFGFLARPSVAYTLFGLFACSVLVAVVRWIPLWDVQQLMNPQPPLPSLSVSEVPVPTGEYLDVAWLKDWVIVEHILYEPSPHPNNPNYPDIQTFRLWKLHPDGTDMQMLDLPSCEGYDSVNFHTPVRLDDTRFSYVAACFNSYGSPFELSNVMAYDLETEQTSYLHDGFLAREGFPVGAYTWGVGATKAVLEEAKGFAERLYWVTRTTLEQIPLGLSRARIPAWSPDGKGIAFWGAVEQGNNGNAMDSFDLYIMDPNGHIIGKQITGFKFPQDLAWSPDSNWLAFVAGSDDTDKKEGVWIVKAGEKQAQQVLRGSYRKVEWSPDGQQLIVTKQLMEPDATPPPHRLSYSEYKLVKVDVGPLVQPPAPSATPSVP